jgi:hypothetical protein
MRGLFEQNVANGIATVCGNEKVDCNMKSFVGKESQTVDSQTANDTNIVCGNIIDSPATILDQGEEN